MGLGSNPNETRGTTRVRVRTIGKPVNRVRVRTIGEPVNRVRVRTPSENGTTPSKFSAVRAGQQDRTPIRQPAARRAALWQPCSGKDARERGRVHVAIAEHEAIQSEDLGAGHPEIVGGALAGGVLDKLASEQTGVGAAEEEPWHFVAPVIATT